MINGKLLANNIEMCFEQHWNEKDEKKWSIDIALDPNLICCKTCHHIESYKTIKECQ